MQQFWKGEQPNKSTPLQVLDDLAEVLPLHVVLPFFMLETDQLNSLVSLRTVHYDLSHATGVGWHNNHEAWDTQFVLQGT